MDKGQGDQGVLLCRFFIRNAYRGRSVCSQDGPFEPKGLTPGSCDPVHAEFTRL